MLAHLVNVANFIGEVAEVAAIRWQAFVTVPVVGQLQRRIVIAICRQIDQREATFFAVITFDFFEAKQRIKRHGGFQIRDADHCVQVFHVHLKVPLLVLALSKHGVGRRIQSEFWPHRAVRVRHL